MDKVSEFLLKSLHKVYPIITKRGFKPDIYDIDDASNTIYDLLDKGTPCMVARFGSTELLATLNAMGVKEAQTLSNLRLAKLYITNRIPQYWWNEKSVQQMETNAGFFPPTHENIMRFSEIMLRDMPQVDILGSWQAAEGYVSHYIKSAIRISLLEIEPYFAKHPWSRILAEKKVLVVHPFATLIERQYQRRKYLFNNPEVLPNFELHTLQAVQSLGGNNHEYKDWFEALYTMEKQMDTISYDIALIGCGAYGFPLAAHAKRTGHKAVHLGGALQLLFGIRGARWEDPNYSKRYNYRSLMNNYWVKPGIDLKPQNAALVENGCYW